MRRMNFVALTALITIASGWCAITSATPAMPQGGGFLRVSDGAFDIDGNVPDLPSINMFDLAHLYMTDPESGRAKLMRARDSGFRMIRFFAAGTYNEASTRFPAVERWKDIGSRQSFYAAYDQLIHDAGQLGVTLVPALVTGYSDPEERTRPSGIACANSPFSLPLLPGSENRERMKEFALDIVGRYRNSTIILFWEITNEGNLNAKHRNPADLCVTREEIAAYFNEMARSIKMIDPNHLVATGAIQEGDAGLPLANIPGSFNDFGDYFRFYNASTDVDIVSVHLYDQFNLSDASGKHQSAGEVLKYFNRIAISMGRPLWIGEFGVPGDTSWIANNLHDTPISILLARHYLGIDLATAWNWESREYGRPGYHYEMVEYSIDPIEDDDIIHVMTQGQDVMGASDAHFSWQVMSGDFNNDGKDDLLAASNRGSWQVSLMGDDPGIPGQWMSAFGDDLRDPGAAPFQRLTGDFNGDGITDIALKGEDGRWFVAIGNGRQFTQPALWLSGFGNAHSDPGGKFVAFAGDWNGDQKTDIGIKSKDGRWFVAFSDGNGFQGESQVLSGFINEHIDNGSGGFAILTGDWNGDGLTDIGAKSRDGRWYLATSTGIAFTYERQALSGFGNDLQDPGGAPFEPIVGDWNGDGKSDIGLKSRDGRWFIAIGDGLHFSGGGQVLSGFGDDLADPSGGPSIPFTGDWNNDGRTDIGLKTKDGRWYIALSSGNGFSGMRFWH